MKEAGAHALRPSTSSFATVCQSHWWLFIYTVHVSAYYFYLPTLAFLVGVALRSVIVFPQAAILFITLIGVSLLVSTSLYRQTSFSRLVFCCGLVVCFLGLGIFRMDVASTSFGDSSLRSFVDTNVILEGQVIKEPEVRSTGTYLYVATDSDTILVQTDRYTDVSYGDTVRVQGTLAIPEVFTTDLGREFDYPKYLLVRGVEYRIAPATVTVIATSGGHWLIRALLAQKNVLEQGIEQVIEAPASGLGLGLLLGIKQALGEDLEAAFRTSGLTHIVVLSGYNVMLVVTFVVFCLSFWFTPKARSVVGIVAIVLFALLVGLSATVVRASIMASLLLIAQFLGRGYALLRALLLAAALMVAVNPYLLLYDIGFQLSFMATLGLILVAPRLESLVVTYEGGITVKDFLIATIATQIAVLPLLLYYIGEVSLVAVVVNVIVLPVVPFAMALTAAAGAVAFISPTIALPIAFGAQLVLSYIIVVAEFFSALPFASFVVPPLSVGWVLVMYTLMAVVLWCMNRSTNKTIGTDWVIEEEETKATDETRSVSSATSPPPIFFR